jgi:cytochrome c oxidase subunit 3
MGFQFLLWRDLKLTGIFVDSTVFGSIIYAFTWIHAAHMVVGILALLWISTSLKGFSEEQLTKMINVEKFWHFLGAIWVIIFFGIFVF